MQRAHWKEFERLAGDFFEKELGVKLFRNWPVHLKNGAAPQFDFASEDERTLIQCKSYTWTVSDRYPNAKMVEALSAIQILRDSSAFRKIIVFDDHRNHKGRSLVEVFVRNKKDYLSGVEVWRYSEGQFEAYFGLNGGSDSADAQAIEMATHLLVDQSSRAHTEIIMSFHEISQRLGIKLETVGRLAGVIEKSLKTRGVRVERMRDAFRLPLPM